MESAGDEEHSDLTGVTQLVADLGTGWVPWNCLSVYRDYDIAVRKVRRRHRDIGWCGGLTCSKLPSCRGWEMINHSQCLVQDHGNRPLLNPDPPKLLSGR